MATICYDDIKKICTDFVNDPDTSIGMECDWRDYLEREVPLDFTTTEIMKAMNVSYNDDNTYDNIIYCYMDVQHEKFGETIVCIGIQDNKIIISTR
jgi:hypothetical protein